MCSEITSKMQEYERYWQLNLVIIDMDFLATLNIMSALDSGDLQSHPFVQPKRWGRALATGQLLLLLPVSAVRPYHGLVC